jgi:hypothetical protein
MYTIVAHVRPNKHCPYTDYLADLQRSGAKKDEAKILPAVKRLKDQGAHELTQIALAKKNERCVGAETKGSQDILFL